MLCLGTVQLTVFYRQTSRPQLSRQSSHSRGREIVGREIVHGSLVIKRSTFSSFDLNLPFPEYSVDMLLRKPFVFFRLCCRLSAAAASAALPDRMFRIVYRETDRGTDSVAEFCAADEC